MSVSPLRYRNPADEPIYVQMFAPDFGTLMQSALTVFDSDTVRAGRFLHELMARDAGAFRLHASRELRTTAGSDRWKFLVGMLSGSGMLIDVLLDPSLLTLPETALLLRQTPGLPGWIVSRVAERTARERYTLEPATVSRIMGIATALDDPSRMLPILASFKNHECYWVRSKAELAVCRAMGDLAALESAAGDPDPRTRASAIEGLWWVARTRTNLIFRSAGRDPCSRVAANAAVGLELAGHVDEAVGFARRLAMRPEASFRRSAIWAMREMGAEPFTPDLHGLLHDPDQQVRVRAQDVLARMNGIH